MQRISVTSLFLFGMSLLGVFSIALFFPEMGFKSLAFSVFAIVFAIVSLIPVRMGLALTFTYVGLEGFFKVISNYNPVIHVGSDLLVLCLCLKVIVEAFSKGEPLPLKKPPFIWLFVVLFVWLFICFFNPYSLGWFASLAGAKIYVTMVLLFFFGYYQVRSVKDFNLIIMPLILVGIIHTLFGLYQGYAGASSVLSLHPRYAIQLAKYQNVAFRPFGLTNLPGGPAVYLSAIFPLILYVIFVTKQALLRWLLIGFLPLGTFLFLLCQVRSALLKMIIGSAIFILGAVFYILRGSSGREIKTLVVSLTLAAVSIVYALPYFMESSIEAIEGNEVAIERSLSLFEMQTLSRARSGFVERFTKYSAEVPFGAGFSRIGAAAGKFKDLNSKDPFFDKDYFFTDNFWLTCIVEIGIPGMLIMTLLLISILKAGYLGLREEMIYENKMACLAIFASLVGITVGLYGAEGILYNPESSFFWFFSGVMMKMIEVSEISTSDEMPLRESSPFA